MTLAEKGDDGFGAYLATVQERDVDLLLMEEFHVSPLFTPWFAEQVGIINARFDGAWHSVTDADGETDLLLRIVANGKRIGILIENKIAAAEQDLQDARYHIRAARAQRAGQFDSFVTCMCAPAGYLASLSDTSLYQGRVSYEEIESWFDRLADSRSVWRRQVMREAISQGRRGYKMVVNKTVSSFHQSFWKYLTTHYPQLIMRRPTPKRSKSSWILFKGRSFPKNVGFHIKMDQQCVELGYRGKSIEEIMAMGHQWPEDILVVQKGKTAALSITTPFLDQTKPLEGQLVAVDETMAAVVRLVPFAHLLG